MQKKCDLFAGYFRDVFVNDSATSQQTFGLEKCADIGSLTLDEQQVIDALENIDTTKGNGPDNISP